MARIRTVKPDLFKHEELFELESETKLPVRLAFIGLWCVCDREGRFKWRPNQLKIDVLPYDKCDFSRVLGALATRGFVVEYESDTGERFGYVPTFLDHQVINNRETKSQLPCPFDACFTRDPRGLSMHKGKGKEGKGKGREEEGNTASTRDAPKTSERELLAEIGVEGQLADDFIQLRKTKKAPISKTVIDGIYREAGLAGISPQQAVSLCVERGWQGFRADWLNTRQAALSKSDQTRQAMRKFIGEDF